MSAVATVTNVDEPTPAEVAAEAFIGRIPRAQKNTRDAYRNDLYGCSHPREECEHPKRPPNPNAWLRWCFARHVDPLQARALHIELWQKDLADAGQSEGTRKRRLSTVSAWYDMLFRDDKVPYNPVHKIDPRHKPKGREPGTTGQALDDDQQVSLLARADEAGPRDSALIALALYTGLRASELASLDIESCSEQRGKGVITFLGKGRKMSRVELPALVWERMKVLIAQPRPDTTRLPALAAGAQKGRPLFLTVTGRRMSRQAIAARVKHLSAHLGLPNPLTAHDIRRTFASTAAELVDINQVREAMRHSSLHTTTAYMLRKQAVHPGELIAQRHEALRETTSAPTS